MKHLLILLVIISIGCANHRVRRVIGGRKASTGQFPYLVSIQVPSSVGKDNLHTCGGVILNERYILTAAHCINGQSSTYLSVLIGTNSLSKGGERYKIQSMRSHQKYKKIYSYHVFPTISSNDLALLRLNRNITFNNVTQPIPIASHKEQIPVGSNLTISGWGSINKHTLIYTDRIQYFRGTLISHKLCKSLYTYKIKKGEMELSLNDICTMTPLDRGICDGDSGGPVVYNGTLVGIVSRTGIVCGIGVPDVHTKVSRYEKWINKSIAQMDKNPFGIFKYKRRKY